MTELAITPNYEKKRLELAGTVAAGEHVAVTIVGGGAWIGTGKALKLRVICGARTVAKFPLWTEDNAEDWPEDVTSADAWDSANEGADATCVLNLNTVPAAKLLRFGCMCLWVLDDAENHTLYGSGEYIVEPWPKERGEDEPYYLDEYPDIVAELGERIDAVEKSISDAVDEANGIVAYVTAARNDAQSAAQIAGTARNGAQTAQGKAEEAQAAAEAALPLDTTLATEGKAADAKAVGDAIALKADRVANATSGNLAAIDSNGNLTDSGMALRDFAVAESLAPAFVAGNAYEVGDLCTSFDNGEQHKGAWLYKCILATDGSQPTSPETDPTHWALATVEDLLAALRTALAGKADASSLAPVATSGNYDDLRGKPGNVSAFANDAGYLTSHQQLRYAMPASVALVAENDAATLVCGDRAVTNATIASGFATLNLTFPAEVSGYVRDFYLRITVAAGESAPALSLPQGVTIENAGGAVPEIADGEASAAATTLVWFSETAPGVFTAKSETVKAVV